MVFHLMPHECQVEEGNDVLCFSYETLLHTLQNLGVFCSILQSSLICSVAAGKCKKCVEGVFLGFVSLFCFFFPVCCLDSFTFYFSTPKHRV